MAEVQLRSTQSISKEKAQLFDWLQEKSSVPYYQQGNRKFESAGMIDQRNKVKYTSEVRASINRFWELLPKNSEGRIEKSPYSDLCLRFSKLLIPDFSKEEILAVVEEDWINDCEGESSLSYSQFYNALFQLADVWTEEISPAGYSDFLMKIYRRVTCKKVLLPNGEIREDLPSIQLVFPDEMKREADWEAADSQEEYDDDFEYKYNILENGDKTREKRLKMTDLLVDTGGIHYDEVVLSQWEMTGKGQTMELAEIENVVPLGQVAEEYLVSLSKKPGEVFVEVEKIVENPQAGKKVVVLSEVTKHKIKQQIGSSFVTLKKSTIKVDKNRISSAVPSARKTIHDFSMSLLKSENKDNPVTIERPGVQTIHEMRKTQLQNKYQPIMKRVERKVSMQAKKGMIEIERDRKKIHVETPEVFYEPIEALKPLYSVEKTLPTDPYVNTLDIISAASQEVIKIVIVGPPRSGKTTLAQELCKSLDLHHIELSSIVERLLAKGKKDEDEEEEEEEGQKKPEIYNEFEKSVINTLLSGESLQISQTIQLLELELESDSAVSKGFILDIPLQYEYFDLLATRSFNLFITLKFTLPDLSLQASGLKWDPNSNLTYSSWHIYELTKPLPKKSEDEEAEEEEQERPRLPVENFLKPAQDFEENLLGSASSYFNTVEPRLLQIPQDWPESLKLEIQAAGLDPAALKSIVLAKLGHRLEKPPAAKKLESESNAKGLLLQNVEEGQEPRAFSIWKQIDPVALFNSVLVQGKPDFSAEYAGNVFLFDNEENQELFVKNPQKYLRTTPKMPNEFRLCIVGPRKAGKHTQAEYLCAKYGWRLIDVPEILRIAMQVQKKNLKDPKPSHPDTGLVQVPDSEFKSVLTGESVPGQNILPIILNRLGIPLMKKPPPPPTPKSDEEVEQNEEPPVKEVAAEGKSDDDKDDSEEKEDKNEEKLKEVVEGIEVIGEEVKEKVPTPPPEPIVYDDLPLTEIVLKKDESGKGVKLQGFVMIGYPCTEEEANALKEFGVEFDKILHFVDPNDGEILIKRGAEDFVDLAKDIALADQAANVCKDAFGEENVLEIKIDGTEQEVHDRVLKALDPFYLNIEDPENIVTKDEGGEDAIVSTASEYSNFDPVILKEHSWLMPGSEDFEVQSLGKKYLFVSEVEMEKFKSSPQKYIQEAPVPVPQPHILVTGPRGSGVKTVISELCNRYKIPEFHLKSVYLRHLEEEKMKRRKSRLLKRGFVPKEINEDDEPYDPLLNDPDIVEEDETFDRALYERQALQSVLPAGEPLVINGKWFEVDEEKVSQPLVDLLYESRRLPEVVLLLRASEPTTIDRLLDKEGITAKYEELMEIRRKEKERVKEEARKEKIQARLDKIAAGEEIDENEEEQEEEEEEGDDPEAPNLESMLDEAKQKLIEMRDADNSAIDDLKEAFESKNIKILEVPSEGSLQRLLQKINHELSPFVLNRNTLLEKNLPIKLKPTKADELLSKNKAKVSCFGKLCPVTPELPTSKAFPVLFRDRVYYPGSEVDQSKLIDAPWLFLEQDTQPKDVDLNVLAAIIGGPASGKTTLAKDLAKEIDVVIISLRTAVSQVLQLDSELANLVRDQLARGLSLSDDLAVEVIAWRAGLSDVLEKGCVLDGFPKNASQAMLLANKNLLPNPVLFMDCDKFALVKRLKSKFKHDDAALALQMSKGNMELLEVAGWYQNTYDNLRYISSNHSKWWAKDSAVQHINAVFTSKRNYAIALIKGTPVRIKNLPITRFEIGKRFGKFKRYDPVVLKYKNELVEVKNDEFLVEYRTKLFAFRSKDTMDVFVKHPDAIVNSRNLPDYLPRRLALMECGDIYESRIELESNCVVTLAEEGQLAKGNPTLLVSYNDKVFCFKNVEQREKFMKRPQKYEKTKLPVKIPPKPDNFVNFILEEFETSVGFLDQMLGQVIIKALLEVGTQKLMFPNLSVKETALKHFALFLKAHNPANSKYQKEKYGNKLWEFKQKCWIQREIYEDGVRKENNELKNWEIENYFAKGEHYEEFIAELKHNHDGYIDKFFR